MSSETDHPPLPDALMEAAAAAAAQGNEESPSNQDDENPPTDHDKPSLPPLAAAAQPQQYSTRGRSTDPTSSPLERLAKQALGELTLRELPPSRAVLSNSFLSDSITEEERRTRTRYIPAVDGMHALRKQQIKADVALMSLSIHSGATNSSSHTNATDKDDSYEAAALEAHETDAAAETSSKRGSAAVPVTLRGGIQLQVPSAAFVAPSADAATTTTATSSSINPPPPTMVDSLVAFNPPRPPESVGSKKKHRMIRWERRPADMEVDLRNYRRTVQRTREELTRAQLQLDRVHAQDAMVRRHYLEHISSQQREYGVLSQELERLSQECVDVAGLAATTTTTRTRQRSGTTKTQNAALLRDAVSVLQTKRREMAAKGLSTSSSMTLGEMMDVDDDRKEETEQHGLGGVNAVNFTDWDRHTIIPPTKLAAGWTLPGHMVETPYGKGEVVVVLGVEKVDPKATPPSVLRFTTSTRPAAATEDADAMQVDEPTTDPTAPAGKETSQKEQPPSNASSGLLVPRVAVRLPFGVGFFPLDAVRRIGSSSILAYSDARLAQRWKGILETGMEFGMVVDSSSIMALTAKATSDGPEATARQAGSSLIPFGAGMIPTAAGRGTLLAKMSVDEVLKEIDTVMFHGAGVLGKKDNDGITKELREREDVHDDNLRLEATVLHLKNQLYRQRRLRILNERTYASTQERAARVEALVSEMRTDLKTLKRRLDEDVADLGIDEEQAEQILKTYYDSLDYKHAGEASPPKRAKKEVMAAENIGLTDEEDDDLATGITGAMEVDAAAS